MQLLTKSERAKLLDNGRRRAKNPETFDPVPVVKLFTPDGGATWVLSELDPEDEDTAFGLCDLGVGFPELGYVSLAELETVRGTLGLPVERDRFAEFDMSIGTYAALAHDAGTITI